MTKNTQDRGCVLALLIKDTFFGQGLILYHTHLFDPLFSPGDVNTSNPEDSVYMDHGAGYSWATVTSGKKNYKLVNKYGIRAANTILSYEMIIEKDHVVMENLSTFILGYHGN